MNIRCVAFYQEQYVELAVDDDTGVCLLGVPFDSGGSGHTRYYEITRSAFEAGLQNPTSLRSLEQDGIFRGGGSLYWSDFAPDLELIAKRAKAAGSQPAAPQFAQDNAASRRGLTQGLDAEIQGYTLAESKLPIMEFNPELAAERLDGYLAAISSLKDDGTFFSFLHLGEFQPEQPCAAFCKLLNVPVADFYSVSATETTVFGVPVLLRDWILERKRIFNSDDSREIDARLFDGFVAELEDLLGQRGSWLELRRSKSSQVYGHLGAIWDVLLLVVHGRSFAIHCSWDS